MTKKQIKKHLSDSYIKFIDNNFEFIIDCIEQNRAFTNCYKKYGLWFTKKASDGDYVRKKLLSKININKLKRIVPQYVQYTRKNGLDLVKLTPKILDEIFVKCLK